jgi:carboxylesterase
MHKTAILFALSLFLTGCAADHSTSNARTEEIFDDIISLRQELESDPNNTELRSSIAEQMFELELETAKLKGVKDSNLPFFIDKGSNISILLVHGFTATPWEVREFGDFLAEKGYNVYGTLLEGHGTTIKDMRKTQWEQWLYDVKNADEALSYISDRVFIVGVSTGGSLGIILAERGYNVDGLVCLACPINLSDTRSWLAPFLKYVYWYQKRNLSEEDKMHYYNYRPIASVQQLTELIDFSVQSIGSIDMPVLIIQSTEDSTVDRRSADYLYSHIGSADKKLVYFEGDNHVLVQRENKDEVFSLTELFIEEHSKI